MKTTYALDSNTVSYFLRGEGNININFHKEVIASDNAYVIPYVVSYEVKRWLRYRPTRQTRAFSQLFDNLFKSVEDDAKMDIDVWDMAAQIYIELRQSGQLIGDADILIAAYCLINDCTLVTRNNNDFMRVSGLKLVNWYD